MPNRSTPAWWTSVEQGTAHINSTAPTSPLRVARAVLRDRRPHDPGATDEGHGPSQRWSDRARSSRDLRASEKDRAENVMIVDLLRNDLGRIAVVGSVRVEELLSIEAYPCQQLTSTIAATLPDPWSVVDVFRAMFPCGSVTSTPRSAAMRASTLETSARRVRTARSDGWRPAGRSLVQRRHPHRRDRRPRPPHVWERWGHHVGLVSRRRMGRAAGRAAVLTSVPTPPSGSSRRCAGRRRRASNCCRCTSLDCRHPASASVLPIDPSTVQTAIDSTVHAWAAPDRTAGARVRLVVALTDRRR